jgi:hypothetical protein
LENDISELIDYIESIAKNSVDAVSTAIMKAENQIISESAREMMDSIGKLMSLDPKWKEMERLGIKPEDMEKIGATIGSVLDKYRGRVRLVGWSIGIEVDAEVSMWKFATIKVNAVGDAKDLLEFWKNLSIEISRILRGNRRVYVIVEPAD